MPAESKSKFWRVARIYFRRFRLALWLCVFFLLGCLVYLNQVGLPGVFKQPLLDKLRARGLELQFSRLRLSFYRGLVAENVRFGAAAGPLTPQLTAGEVRMQLSLAALSHAQFQVTALEVSKGRLVMPLSTNASAPRELTVENIQTELRLLPGDAWSLDHFHARFGGAEFQLTGLLEHASEAVRWQSARPKTAGRANPWPARLNRWADILERTHFASPPDLKLDVRGDARDLDSFSVRLLVSAPDADTPWARVKKGRLSVHVAPAVDKEFAEAALNLEAARVGTDWGSTTNVQLSVQVLRQQGQTNWVRADIKLSSSQAQTRWAAGSALSLTARLVPMPGQTNLVQGELNLEAAQASTRWGSASNTHLAGRWVHALTNPIPLTGEVKIESAGSKLKWGAAKAVQVTASFAYNPTNQMVEPGVASANPWLPKFQPYGIDFETHVAALHSPDFDGTNITAAGSWHSPQLNLKLFQARIGDGELKLQAGLDALSRKLEAQISSDIEPLSVSQFLTEGARRWLGQFSWTKPPKAHASISVVLPSWTNREPDWRGEVQPTLLLDGAFELNAAGAYKGVPIASARSHFSYSNMCWHLPDLLVTRPEGELAAEHRANDRTKDYYWHLRSTADFTAFRSLVDTNAQRGFDLVKFTEPPNIEAEVWGRWHDHTRSGFRGAVQATNFTFRGESLSGLQTRFDYTNEVLHVDAPRLQIGDGRLSADGLLADFRAELVFLTNGFSTAPPMVVARAIGPHIARALEPYVFSHAPTAHAWGTIPMHRDEDADLHFQLEGGPFQWSGFNASEIAGRVDWTGLHLVLTNVEMTLHSGHAHGHASFDFHPKNSTDYAFSLTTTNTLLQFLMEDIRANNGRTNQAVATTTPPTEVATPAKHPHPLLSPKSAEASAADTPPLAPHTPTKLPATNHLEGLLSGTLVVTSANSDDWKSVNGYGNATLVDGVIWDIPLFGKLTPLLNSISPGLGSTRADSGTCSFIITNGVVRSDDLEIHTPAFRLLYHGSVDLQQQVNARVDAQPLRDMWVLGPLLSTAFWPVSKIFEYKVTGTLADPKPEPLLIPRLILSPLHPFKTLKGLLPENNSSP